MVDEMTALFTNLGEEDGVRMFPGATDDEIAAFERESGVTLPEGYKAWLRLSDGSELFLPAGLDLYSMGRDGYKQPLDADDPDKPGDGYVVIGRFSNGDPLLAEEDSERISIYNLEGGRIEDDETYPDFLTFIGDIRNILGVETSFLTSDTVEGIVGELQDDGRSRLLPGATDDEIAVFEKSSGVVLPEEYTEWLRLSDGGELFDGVQLHGVAHKPLLDVDDPDGPGDGYLVIGTIPTGDPVTCRTADGWTAVYDREAGELSGDEQYPDFLAFLKDVPNILGVEDDPEDEE